MKTVGSEVAEADKNLGPSPTSALGGFITNPVSTQVREKIEGREEAKVGLGGGGGGGGGGGSNDVITQIWGETEKTRFPLMAHK